MARVDIKFSDEINMGSCIDADESEVNDFLNKYQTELDEFKSVFFTIEDDEIYALMSLQDMSISTQDEDPKSNTILNFLSSWTKDAKFRVGFGLNGFSDEFYKDLFSLAGSITIDFQATVIGYGDEFYKCSYELTEKGWKGYDDLYSWNEDIGNYECQ